MNVLVLFGSPRRNGNTIKLVNAYTEAVKRKGHNVRTLYLNDMNIRPCQGCLACLEEGQCRINDDMKDTRKFMMESDIILFASPVYWFSVSAQLKLAIDRSIAFMDNQYNSRIKGKKAVTLMTCASEDHDVYTPALGMFRKTFDLLGLSYVGGVEATGCTDDENGVAETFIGKARELTEQI